MTSYILKRLLLFIPTLLGVLLVTFVVIQFVPGGPVEQYLAEAKAGASGGVESGGSNYRGNQGVDPKRLAEIKALYGFDKPAHERFFELLRLNTFQASRRGAAMARVILASLAGEPIKTVPAIGPDARLVALAGHDGNLSQMAGVFGLNWSLPQDQPDATAPATTLAFELWKDTASGETFVRPVLYYATLDQLRTLAPAIARKLPLQLDDCASGPMGSCSLETVRKRVEALLPEDCGEI